MENTTRIQEMLEKKRKSCRAGVRSAFKSSTPPES